MFLTFRRWMLDKFCLRPSTDQLDCGGKRRFKIPSGYHHLQAFSEVVDESSTGKETPDLLVIKWPGNAGRAEQAGPHPAMAWPEKRVELWTINPFGYGESSKSASLRHLSEMASAVSRHAKASRPGVPILLLGNSIGSLTALHQAAQFQQSDSGEGSTAQPSPLVGLVLLNPPALKQLILGHYHKAYYGPVTKWLVNALVAEADGPGEAAKVNLPCFFVQSLADEIVPPRYQDPIFEALAGPKLKWISSDCDHNTLPSLEPGSKYLKDLQDFFRESLS